MQPITGNEDVRITGHPLLIPSQTAEVVSCPLCQMVAKPAFSGQSWRISGGRSFSYARCGPCDLAFCNPTPMREELNRYYASEFDYSWYQKRWFLKKLQGAHRWMVVQKPIEKALGGRLDLLDIGCGHGWFLRAASGAGWNVRGIELSSEAASFARERLGLDVDSSTIEALVAGGTRFSVVTMWHSLEHMAEPIKTLRAAVQLLKPGGVLLVAVPNLASRGLAKMGVRWVWLQQPFVHLWHFSPRAIQACCAAAEVQVLKVWTRDTWDAQFLFDGLFADRVNSIAHRISKIPAIGARFLGRDAEAFRSECEFLLQEAARLGSYAYTLIHDGLKDFVSRSPPTDRSELLVMVQRAV